MELAKRVIANAPLTNFGVIQALPRIARADPDTGLLLESLMASVAAADDEAKMRLRAFLEKRRKCRTSDHAVAFQPRTTRHGLLRRPRVARNTEK
jgi:hypothetical protein